MDHVVVVLDPLPEDLGGAAAFVAQRFRIPEDRALQLLRRAPGPVTKAVPEAQARTVAAILAEAGLHVEMREGGPDGPAVPFAAPVSAPTPVPDARPGAPDAADGGEPQACGWINDRFGVRWQIVPAVLDEMMSDADPERSKRVSDAFLKMVKLDIAALEDAYAIK